MAKVTASKSKKKVAKKRPIKKKFGGDYELPTGRSEPVTNPWQYAYLITGEKKIGKTSLFIQGCEEYVLQFDKPQLSYELREDIVDSWAHFTKILKALEKRAKAGTFPYERIIIDGAGEWYAMCQTHVCEKMAIEHPSDAGFAKAWHGIRDLFTDAVNRLLALQITAKCGVVFIAHATEKEIKTRDGEEYEKLVPNLPGACEEILNGKVDGWFAYIYDRSERVLITRGDEFTGAGHRIDQQFFTTDGRQVEEIYMGKSPKEALANFLLAFENKQTYATYKEFRMANKEGGKASKKKVSKKKFAKKKSKRVK